VLGDELVAAMRAEVFRQQRLEPGTDFLTDRLVVELDLAAGVDVREAQRRQG
jgi:hypothetical protein